MSAKAPEAELFPLARPYFLFWLANASGQYNKASLDSSPIGLASDDPTSARNPTTGEALAPGSLVMGTDGRGYIANTSGTPVAIPSTATTNTWSGEQTFGGGAAFLDDDAITLGTGDDDTIVHNGTNTTWTHTTGPWILDNTDVNDATVIRFGTDTNATGLEFRNNSDAWVWKVNPTSATAGRLTGADGSSFAFGADADVVWTHDGIDSVRVTNAANGVVSFDDDVFRVCDPVDATKCWRLDTGDVKTATTRVGSAPDINIGLGGVAYASTSVSTAITGANENETAFDRKVTLTANMLKAGTVVEVWAFGRHTATNGAETLALKLKIGATELVADAGVDAANADIFAYVGTFVVQSVGASGSIVGLAQKRIGSGGTAMVPVTVLPTAIDTTVANDVAVYIYHQTGATDSTSAQLEMMVVKVNGVPV